MSEAAATDVADVPVPAPETSTRALKDLAETSDKGIADWIMSMGGEVAVRITIKRTKPKTWRGHHVGGTLETVEEMIDEEYIRDMWGGGVFQLLVSKKNGRGNWTYAPGARTIEIAGPPKLDGLVGEDPVTPPGAEDPGLASKAFSAMERNAQRAQERADRAESQARHNGGIDLDALAALNAPMVAQVEELRKSNELLQGRLYDMLGKQPEGEPFKDKMFEKMLDGESSRIESILIKHDSELRSLKTIYQADIDRLHTNHKEDLRTRENAHERELTTVRNSYEAQVKSNEVAYNTRIDGLKHENDRLDRELVEGRTRVATLEAKKDKTITEQAEELMAIRDALGGLGGGGDETPKPWYERLLEAAGESSVVANLLGIGDVGAAQAQLGAQQTAQAQQQMMPPVGVPYQAPDGNIYVRQPDGSVAQVDPAAVRRQRAAQKKKGKKKAEQQQSDPVAPGDNDIRNAITFLEGPLVNGMPPEIVGQTARNLIPSEILNYMATVGIDEFLKKVTQLEPNSPLNSQRGRNFCRKVAAFLFEGATE